MQFRPLMKSGHRPVAGMQFLAGHWPTYSVTSDLRTSPPLPAGKLAHRGRDAIGRGRSRHRR